jgi:hypothetical protein
LRDVKDGEMEMGKWGEMRGNGGKWGKWREMGGNGGKWGEMENGGKNEDKKMEKK